MKTSTKGIIGVLLTLLGTVAASSQVQAFLANFLTGFASKHPVVASLIGTVSIILSLVHVPVKPS